jgi:hypothetical protein
MSGGGRTPTGSGGPAEAGPGGPTQRRAGGPPILFAVVGGAGVLLGAVVIALSLLGGGGASVTPGPSATPPRTGEATARTRELVVAALGNAGLQVAEAATPYRPSETPELLAAPRLVLQVTLPDDPTGGYVVIYELPSAADAAEAGRGLAAHLASGPGAIQYPADTRFIIRQQGVTLVFFAWSPAAATDGRTGTIADALAVVGLPIPIPAG